MKIEREKEEFKPVKVVLETQCEVDILCHLLAAVAGEADTSAKQFTVRLFEQLSCESELKAWDWPATYFEGTVTAVS